MANPIVVGSRVIVKTKREATSGKGTVMELLKGGNFQIMLDNGTEVKVAEDALARLKGPVPKAAAELKASLEKAAQPATTKAKRAPVIAQDDAAEPEVTAKKAAVIKKPSAAAPVVKTKAAAVEAEPVKRRGRPPGSKNKPKDGAVVALTGSNKVAFPPNKVAATSVAAASNATGVAVRKSANALTVEEIAEVRQVLKAFRKLSLAG